MRTGFRLTLLALHGGVRLDDLVEGCDFSDEDIQNVIGGNVLRVLSEIWRDQADRRSGSHGKKEDTGCSCRSTTTV